jgi:hypothetical protein
MTVRPFRDDLGWAWQAFGGRAGRHEQCAPDDFEAVADAMGVMLITVVASYKPGRYPTRVFYTRQWCGPDGVVYGKNGLRMTTATAFARLVAGYRYPFKLPDGAEVAAA